MYLQRITARNGALRQIFRKPLSFRRRCCTLSLLRCWAAVPHETGARHWAVTLTLRRRILHRAAELGELSDPESTAKLDTPCAAPWYSGTSEKDAEKRGRHADARQHVRSNQPRHQCPRQHPPCCRPLSCRTGGGSVTVQQASVAQTSLEAYCVLKAQLRFADQRPAAVRQLN